MAPMPRRTAAALALPLLAALTFPAIAEEPAPAKQKGDSWEVTSQMSMEGMPMALPAHTMKVCAQKDQPPVQGDEKHKCTNSDFRKDGQKVTWKTVCEGGMTGAGEITYSDADHYAGQIKFSSSQGNMTAKLSGKRLGDCDLPK